MVSNIYIYVYNSVNILWRDLSFFFARIQLDNLILLVCRHVIHIIPILYKVLCLKTWSLCLYIYICMYMYVCVGGGWLVVAMVMDRWFFHLFQPRCEWNGMVWLWSQGTFSQKSTSLPDAVSYVPRSLSLLYDTLGLCVEKNQLIAK